MPDEIRDALSPLQDLTVTEIILRLYVTGRTQSAARAIAAVGVLREKLGLDKVRVEIVDVLDDPISAVNDDVYATPTIFRVKPGPVRRLFGNIASVDALIAGLQLTD